MSMERALGFGCGILVGLLLVYFLLKWTKKDGTRKCKYDERQELIRGRGFKYGFFTMIICNFLYASVDVIMDRRMIDSYAGMFICILVGMLVHISYCIWNGGYFALNENPKKVLIAFIAIALLNFGIFAMNLAHGEVMQNGMLTFRVANLFCGIMFLAIFAILLAKKMHDKGEE